MDNTTSIFTDNHLDLTKHAQLPVFIRTFLDTQRIRLRQIDIVPRECHVTELVAEYPPTLRADNLAYYICRDSMDTRLHCRLYCYCCCCRRRRVS